MTDASAILATLAAAGLSVRLADGKLLLSPKDRITDDLRQQVAAGRAGLVAEFERRQAEVELDAAVCDLAPGLSGGLLGPPEWIPRRRAER